MKLRASLFVAGVWVAGLIGAGIGWFASDKPRGNPSLIVAVLTASAVLGAGLCWLISDIDREAPVRSEPPGVVVTTPSPALPAPIPGLPECPTEDSVGPCNWYGGSNGRGARFAALPEPATPTFRNEHESEEGDSPPAATC